LSRRGAVIIGANRYSSRGRGLSSRPLDKGDRSKNCQAKVGSAACKKRHSTPLVRGDAMALCLESCLFAPALSRPVSEASRRDARATDLCSIDYFFKIGL